jgi:hypothetical protein
MWKISLIVLLALVFSGCSMTYEQFKDGYKSAKVIYRDVRYVVYEVDQEVHRVEDEGFGVESTTQSSTRNTQ